MILAVELDRTMVLPRLLLNGSQSSDADVTEDSGDVVHFRYGLPPPHTNPPSAPPAVSFSHACTSSPPLILYLQNCALTLTNPARSCRSPRTACRDLFDLSLFVKSMKPYRLRVAVDPPAPSKVTSMRLTTYKHYMHVLQGTYASQRHLRSASALLPAVCQRHSQNIASLNTCFLCLLQG